MASNHDNHKYTGPDFSLLLVITSALKSNYQMGKTTEWNIKQIAVFSRQALPL